MPRNYVRKTVLRADLEDKLRFAVGEVLSGRSSIRQAAKRSGLPNQQ